MSPPEDAPLSRWSWLDWWFAPRWRALGTWVALAGLAAAALQYTDAWDRLWFLSLRLLPDVNRYSPVSVPYTFVSMVWGANFYLSGIWFEPFALRFDLLRGALWLGVRFAPFFVVTALGTYNLGETNVRAVYYLFPTMALTVVLWGWRSRPWMAVIGGAMAFTADGLIARVDRHLGLMVSFPLACLAYAPVLLYGTRLLRPKDRMRISF